MAQPCGRVCGVKGQYKTYLRSSQIICLGDTLSVLAQLCIIKTKMRLSLASSLNLVILRRFEIEGENERGLDSLSALRYTTWLRWSFFIIGTICPAFKLLAMTGVPWTKTWGFTFLVSFFFVELLIILSWMMDQVSTSNYTEYMLGTDTQFLGSVNTLVDSTEFSSSFIAIALHFSLLFYILADLWGNEPSHSKFIANFLKPDKDSDPRSVWKLFLISASMLLQLCSS
jgi:hypothetical protein